jgi:hypothetical protein
MTVQQENSNARAIRACPHLLSQPAAPLRLATTLMWGLAAIVATSLSFFAPSTAHSAPLRLVIHEDTGAEGDALPPLSRFNPVKRAIEKAISRPVDIV